MGSAKIAISLEDPAYAHYTHIRELPQHGLLELKRFFEDYKTLENKTVVIDDLLGAEAAVQIIRESLDLYKKLRRGEIHRK